MHSALRAQGMQIQRCPRLVQRSQQRGSVQLRLLAGSASKLGRMIHARKTEQVTNQGEFDWKRRVVSQKKEDIWMKRDHEWIDVKIRLANSESDCLTWWFLDNETKLKRCLKNIFGNGRREYSVANEMIVRRAWLINWMDGNVEHNIPW